MSLRHLPFRLILAGAILVLWAPLPRASAVRLSSAGPGPGPQALRRVPANAFPIHQGFGDARFGVVQAFAAPAVADSLHVGWERVQILWPLLQPDSPLQWDYNATGQDRAFDHEIAQGRHLVGVLLGVPAWAAQNPRDGSAAVPRNIDLPWSDARNYWGQFVYRAVRHYAGRIDTFIVLNEVNIATGTFHQFRGSVAQYAQILRVAYLAAHAANPHVEIHIYGDNTYADYGAWFDQTLDALARYPGARDHGLFFDAAEMHLYTSVLQWPRIFGIWRADMLAHGIDKPIWVSETNVAPRDDPVRPSTDPRTRGLNAPLALQPAFLVQSFAASLGLGAPRVEVYLMRDNPGRDAELLGLVRYDGSLRPEATTFAVINRWLAGVWATRYDPGSEPLNDGHPLWRVTMERPGQEISVIWNGSGRAITAAVPAVAATATVVQPSGATATVRARGGAFAFSLAAATDPDAQSPPHFKIGGTPLIVVQDLPPGRHVPGLRPLFVEQDRTTGVGTALGAISSVALAPDGSGTRVVADTSHDRVLVEDAAGHLRAQIGRTGGDPGQFRGPAGLAIGADGTLYVADQGNARIQEFDLSGHLLGGFGQYDDPLHPMASLKAPAAVAAAPDGTIYVLDEAQDAVLHFTRMGAFLGRWGASGYGTGQFDGPSGLAVDRSGTVYVADTLNNRVEAFDRTGQFIGQVGIGRVGAGGDSLHWPVAVAPLSDGSVAISDAGNARVVVAANPRTYLGAVSLAGLQRPAGLATAPDGSYYVSDSAGNQLVHLDAAGHRLASFGTRGRGPGQVLNPMGLALGSDGTLYVADAGNNRIDVLRTAIGKLTFVRSFGHQGQGPGQFLGPQQVALAPDGTLWVADTANARIQHLRSDGTVIDATVITHVGGAWGVVSDGHDGVYYAVRYGQTVKHWTPRGTQTFGSGQAGTGSGEFNHPGALAAAAGGQVVYVVDEGNQRLQVIANGTVVGQRGGADPAAGGLDDPVAVAVAPDHTIAVLDTARRRIVRYEGASGSGFQIITVPDTPLGLGADSHGLVVCVYDPVVGRGQQRVLTGATSP